MLGEEGFLERFQKLEAVSFRFWVFRRGEIVEILGHSLVKDDLYKVMRKVRFKLN